MARELVGYSPVTSHDRGAGYIVSYRTLDDKGTRSGVLQEWVADLNAVNAFLAEKKD